MRRNWTAIAQLADYSTRVALSLATDPELLERFQCGWPECFEEGEDTGPRRIPLSVLQAAVNDYFRESLHDESGCNETRDFCRYLWLAVAWSKHRPLDLPMLSFGEGQETPEVPEEIVEQFVGQAPRNMIRVKWGGKDYIVVDVYFWNAKHPDLDFNPDMVFEESPDITLLCMVLAEFINLEA